MMLIKSLLSLFTDLYQVSVPENMATGSSVISVEAYDPDLGSNGHLNFDILAADVSYIL